MTKKKRFPGWSIVKAPSHMLDSLWLRDDSKALRIVFATGQIADFTPIEENSIASLHLNN